MIVTDKLSTESFHAFIDEQLTDEQYVQVEAQLDEIPEKIEEIQQCHIINERLREVFDPIVEEPVPEDLYDLAIYGLEQEQTITEEGYGYEPGLYTDLEEDIAAIDSLDIFPESEGQSYIDDSDAEDLELLAKTEHLTGFDIDSLRSDSSNIIPDIFDDTDAEQTAEQEELAETPLADPTDDLLESIDTLSMELEKTHQKKTNSPEDAIDEDISETDLMQETSRNLVDELDSENLELEPLENEVIGTEQHAEIQEDFQEYNTQTEEGEDEHLSAKEQVLETLTPDEELTLEPLEEHSRDAFVQEEDQLTEQDIQQQDVKPQKSTRPRNIRADQGNRSDANTVFDPELNSNITPDSDNAPFESENKTVGNSAEALPEDLVAEFFEPNKGPDFEVNEVVRQFEEVSENFADTVENQYYDDSPFANLKYRALDFVDSITARMNEVKSIVISKKEVVLSKFNGGQPITDFNKSPFDNYSTSPVSQSSTPADTLDLGAFEDAARESLSAESDFSNKVDIQEDQQDFFSQDNATPDATLDGVSNGGASLADQGDFFNIEPSENIEKQEPKQAIRNTEDKQEIISPAIQATKPEETHFNMDIGVGDDVPESGNLVNRFGDTLRFYKQKIAEMRASSSGTDGNFAADENFSVFGKHKTTATDLLQKFQTNNKLKFGSAAVLATLLLLGVLVFSFTGGSSQTINNDGMEKLAIDAHLLNNQFNSKITPDADSAIIEKLQWFSARIGRPVRLADIKVEDFEFKKVTIVPTMASFAATNIFENKAGQRMTLMAIPDIEGLIDSPLSCRIPSDVDGLCVWVKNSVRYIAVANLSLSRVRSFSEQIIENT